MERGRHARRWSSTRNAGRRGALRGGLGSKTHNAFCSALGPGRGRRRKAVNRVERNKSKLQLICPSTWSNSYRPAVQPQGFTPVMGEIFDPDNFVNQICWRRTTAHGDAKQGAQHFDTVDDTILFFAKSEEQKRWNTQYVPFSDE